MGGYSDKATSTSSRSVVQGHASISTKLLERLDDDLERQEDELAHHMIKQQVTSVNSPRECVV